jgi:hypothetical protein
MIYQIVSFHSRTSTRRSSFLLSLISALTLSASARPITASDPVPPPTTPIIVVGFVGGFVRHDDMVHSAVQVAANLSKDYPSGLYVEVLENRGREKAHADIVRWIDTNRDGTISPEEKRSARIILYGHSWGASEAITLARQLGKEGIPVLLTIQVDSVAKPGENDKVIPANVAEAANFYQLNGFLHGEPQIRAADPVRTRIIGNFRFDYKANPIDCRQYPWYDRLFMKFHTEIECDPKVWGQVESLIHSRLSSLQ